ncbi:Aromatic-L-amino-acid decarboxylase [Echinococcus granulosus]|uniref:Aromatic-L-amino-acid decarboxylase n=1 Tax=Echinococcus granulosus TaxID=6210 RepID=W6V1L1_ECHGR|nr:Aromatic-L-amino-acid decarboxylase [Echinococcus granulosus]EUB59754.1 Aromatic-L-amino-acid decarboxylase [Echinococcus granulosus]
METIVNDVDRLLLPGVAHWNHPHIHAYVAMTNSYPAMFANIVNSGMEGIGFTWTTCSEQAIVTMMAACNEVTEKCIPDHPGDIKYEALSKPSCYGLVRASALTSFVHVYRNQVTPEQVIKCLRL